MQTPAETVMDFWRRVDARDWDGMAELLDAQFLAEYCHTGEEFDRDEFVELNRTYPGHWRAVVEEVVASDNEAVTRTRVKDGQYEYVVASFATVRDGAITRLIEVWTETAQAPPDLRSES